MEIIIQTFDTRKELINYICTELSECIHLQPGQEKKINLSLDLRNPEYFRVQKDETRPIYILHWFKDNAFISTINISSDITEMAKDVEALVDEMIRLASIEAEKASFEQKCYELYQLEWMMSHNHSLNDLYNVMLKYEKEIFDPNEYRTSDGSTSYEVEDLERSAMQARDILLFKRGFGGSEIWKTKGEFLGAEYQDAAYMKWLFETQVDEEADKLKALYTKYTGKQLSCVADLKVHTEAGTLRAYRLMDPKYPGICVMLQPKGHDVEIDVTMAEANGKNINIVSWGDATTANSTYKETLLVSDIDLRPRVFSKEELKPIIFDEWKKFTFYEFTYCDGEHITTGEIDNMPQELLDEIAFRCEDIETNDITQNIRACLKYAKENGIRALIKEMDDCNIWKYIG